MRFASPPRIGSTQRLPSRSMAIDRRSGDTAAAIDVPSVRVRLIWRVMGTSCAADRRPSRSGQQRRRRSTQSPQSTQSYLFRTVSGGSCFRRSTARLAFFVAFFVRRLSCSLCPSVTFVSSVALCVVLWCRCAFLCRSPRLQLRGALDDLSRASRRRRRPSPDGSTARRRACPRRGCPRSRRRSSRSAARTR